MKNKTKYIEQIISFYIAFGFFSKDEIIQEIEELIKDEKLEVSNNWLLDIINSKWDSHIKASIESTSTDIERLIAAFDDLCRQNIIALHNAGYNTNDGIIEVYEIEQILKQNNKTSKGFCFYSQKNLEMLLKGKCSNLIITFNRIANTKECIAVDVGNIVEKTLVKYGLTTNWNGIATQNIILKNFCWRHIYNKNNRNLIDYSFVINQLLKN